MEAKPSEFPQEQEQEEEEEEEAGDTASFGTQQVDLLVVGKGSVHPWIIPSKIAKVMMEERLRRKQQQHYVFKSLITIFL